MKVAVCVIFALSVCAGFTRIPRQIRHRPNLWYSTEYLPKEDERLPGIPAIVRGRFSYSVNGNSMISMYIKDGLNDIVRVVQTGQPNSSGEHLYSMELDVIGWKKGSYRLEVVADYSNIVASLPFEL